MIENLSLSQLKTCEKFLPTLAHFAARHLVANYGEFVEVLYRDIDQTIETLQQNRELRQKDSEDRITIDIVNLLVAKGYDASNDEKYGGHTDLLVKKESYVWIGEAKFANGSSYLFGGFNQLCTRYSTGDHNQSAGGILIYIKRADAKDVMSKWKTHLEGEKLRGYTATSCRKRSLSFFSEHTHPVSGEPFSVRHMPVLLHFDPQDKSALASKAKLNKKK